MLSQKDRQFRALLVGPRQQRQSSAAFGRWDACTINQAWTGQSSGIRGDQKLYLRRNSSPVFSLRCPWRTPNLVTSSDHRTSSMKLRLRSGPSCGGRPRSHDWLSRAAPLPNLDWKLISVDFRSSPLAQSTRCTGDEKTPLNIVWLSSTLTTYIRIGRKQPIWWIF